MSIFATAVTSISSALARRRPSLQALLACAALVAETIVEEHRQDGPSLQHDYTCAQVLSKLFAQRHAELVEDVRSHRALTVQVRGRNGYALMRFPPGRELHEFQVLVHREHGVWAMDVPLDNGAQ